MLRKIWELIFPKKIEPLSLKSEPKQIDLRSIDESFETLSKATETVMMEAVSTAKALQEKLEVFERKFAIITDSVDDVIIVKTVGRVWVSVNKFACQVFHLNREDILGKSNEEVALLYPKLKPILKKMELAEKEAWEQRKTTRFGLVIEEGQRKLYLDTMITPIDNGNPETQELIIVGHNNTKFYEYVERSKACGDMLNNSSDPVMVIDANKKVFFVNNAYSKEFGFDYEEAISKAFLHFVPSEFVMSINELYEDKEYKNRTICGEKYDVEIVPIINKHLCEPLYFTLFFRMK